MEKYINNFEKLKKWIETGNEIEFTYKGEEYSVTYPNDGEISFCKFYIMTNEVLLKRILIILIMVIQNTIQKFLMNTNVIGVIQINL